MSEYLNKIVYLNQDQYDALMASTNNPKTITVNGITHTYDASSLYITSNKGDADTVNGHTVNIDVPYNAIFTDHYHTTGTWDDITYTATSVNGANPLTFTLPTDNRYYKLDGSNTGTKLCISTQAAAYTNQIQFMNSTTKKGSIGTDNSGVMGIYGVSKVVLRPELDASTKGVEITSSAMYPTVSITLGTSDKAWSTIYGNTITINSTSKDEHINFSRTGGHSSPNYINVPNGGALAISTNSAAAANIVAMFESTGIVPYTTNTLSVGTSTYKWANIYATNFNGTKVALTHAENGSDGLNIDYSTTIDFFIGIGTANENHGLYDRKAAGGAKWILSANATNVWTFVGSVTGNADSATAAHITTTANAVAYYSDTTGTFASKASADGALYATSANGTLQWGKLPIAQGGTGATSFTKDCVIVSDGASTPSLVSRGLTVTGATNAAVTVSVNNTNSGLTIKPNGSGAMTLSTAGGILTISTTSGNISLSSGGIVSIDSGSSKTISINSGSTLTFNSATNTAIEFQKNSTTAWSFSADGTNISPSTTDTISLGTSSYHWSAVYIGGADSYGDAYTPVYWHDGVPEEVIPTQYVAFTIKSGKYGVTLTSDAFTADSEVLEIVVTTNAQNLKDKISWTSDDGYINLTTDVVPDANVTGYIIVSRGGSVTPTATDITTAS